MLPEAKEKRIKSLSTKEILHEITLGRRSRFQREAFSYLETQYQLRIKEEELTKIKDKTQSPISPIT